jgi:hypothetical protein
VGKGFALTWEKPEGKNKQESGSELQQNLASIEIFISDGIFFWASHY